ncbi:MAG TPA: anti-sigma factor [Planctomycetota bacterium]
MNIAPEPLPQRPDWRWSADSEPVPTVAHPPKGISRLAWLAAGFALVFAGLLGGPAVDAMVETAPETRREHLIAGTSPYQTARWLPGTAADVEDLGGDVIWCPEKSEGWVRVVGLPHNDAEVSHYQLWILDNGRSSGHPVPAGRFDMPAGERHLVVAMDPRLELVDPSVVVLTREAAEGAVVPDPGAMLLVASLR